ncbi:bromodomain-containing protein 8-like isoform X2 [Littorina saxatilis]|uniref:Bromo domain-containing protein n=2 Tax=Littorina saxatilis TaxID=31220 RepID=A0AAN9BQ30_9CAEN
MAAPTQAKMKVKGGMLDTWSLKEKLALGCSVQRSGDQNWVSVSRAIKPYGELHRPSDWFQPRNCATQYSSLLEKVETPKRKRADRGETEVPTKQIVVKLTIERIEELKKQVVESQQQYKKLKRDLECIYTGQWDDQIKEKWEEAQAAMQAEEETKKEEETKLKEMYSTRAAILSQMKGVRRASASSQSNVSEADDTTPDSMADPVDVSLADEDSMDTLLPGSGLPTLTLPTTPVTGDASAKANPPPSPLLSHLLKSSHKSPYSLQRIKQEQELVMKQEQQSQVEGGGPATTGTAQSGDIPSTEVTPSALLTSQQSDTDGATVVIPVKEEADSEVPDTASREADALEVVNIKQEITEDVNSQESMTSSENSSDQKLSSIADIKQEEGTRDSTDQRPEQTTDAEIESQDDDKSDVEGGNYMSVDEEVSVKEEPASPASSVISNISQTPSGRRGKGRVSRGRTSQRVTRKSFAEKDDASSKHSEAEFTDEDIARESDDILSHLAQQSTAASTFTESVPSSPASVGVSDTEDEKAYKIWKKSIMLVWRAAANHKYANVFLHPVTNDIAPGYDVVVLRPMDMLSIKKNIESGTTRTTAEFQRDMMLMFTNAMMYNSSNHNVYKMAKEMYDDVMQHIEQYVSTQMMMQSAEAKVLRTSRRGDTSEKEEDPKKRRSSIEQPQEGGKTKKRKSRGDE